MEAERTREQLIAELSDAHRDLAVAEERIQRLVDVLPEGALGTSLPSREKIRERAAYDGVQGAGEARERRSEEHLCDRCVHGQVCELAGVVAYRENLMAVVFRCLGFLHVTDESEEAE